MHTQEQSKHSIIISLCMSAYSSCCYEHLLHACCPGELLLWGAAAA